MKGSQNNFQAKDSILSLVMVSCLHGLNNIGHSPTVEVFSKIQCQTNKQKRLNKIDLKVDILQNNFNPETNAKITQFY